MISKKAMVDYLVAYRLPGAAPPALPPLKGGAGSGPTLTEWALTSEREYREKLEQLEPATLQVMYHMAAKQSERRKSTLAEVLRSGDQLPKTLTSVRTSRAPEPIKPLSGSGVAGWIEERLQRKRDAGEAVRGIPSASAQPSRRETTANWAHWRIVPKLHLWEAVLLSMNIEPDRETAGGVDGSNLKRQTFLGEDKNFSSDERVKEFQRRLDVLIRYCDIPGTFSILEKYRNRPDLNEVLNREAAGLVVKLWPDGVAREFRELATEGETWLTLEPNPPAPPVTEDERQAAFARQAKGLFTIVEAAKLIAVQHGLGDDGQAALEHAMLRDAVTGKLPTRDVAGGMLRDPASPMATENLVTPEDVNPWLIVSYRRKPEIQWIVAGQSSSPTVSDDAASSPSERRVVHKLATGPRNVLTPVIELAQSKCRNSDDGSEVWGVLIGLAQEQHPPLLGYTETKGIKYTGGREPYFTFNALTKRLKKAAKRR
jgi:hypothetical protein